MTSGRSGLASAVIYQPSIPSSYIQDCISNLSHNREYDDKGGSEGHEDDHDLMSRGNRQTYHVNLSGYGGQSGGQMDNLEPSQCEQFRNLKMKIIKRLKKFNQKFIRNNEKSKPCSLSLISQNIQKLILKEKFNNKSHKKIKSD